MASNNDQVNILVVDDQPAKLLGYEAILGELGETLIKAGSAREALDQLLKRDIAVILIDVIMPELDGFELASLIRSHPRFETTPIIFVSALALTDIDHIKGYEYGAVDYVPVPVVPQVLRAKVRFFVEMHRKTRQLEALNVELEQRVAERTADLEKINADLELRVEERTREREAAMQQLHEMQKLESLGKITGGLAHDFNNLLNAVIGNLEPLSNRLEGKPALKKFVTSAIEAAERGANLTSRLLAFARRQELRPERVEVSRLVKGMSDLLKRSVGPTVEIASEFPTDLSAIRVDPNQFELAVLNLAVNARDALESSGGGRLTITARNESVMSGIAADLAGGDYVCVVVTDNGTGMDERTLRRATEPFFTTKEIGKGTGLGLAMVHGLAAQSGGAIRIHSALGQGTTVELWFPMAEAQDEVMAPVVQPAATRVTPACKALLVDDDPMVADGTVAMLNDLGHTVTVARSGAEALEILATNKAFDFIITDHAMPGMTGIELAHKIRAMKPSLPVILATGYAELAEGESSGLPRLDKPYRMSKLAALIESLVGNAMAAASAPRTGRDGRSQAVVSPPPTTGRTTARSATLAE
ncbi:MAG TPA: response regulator [Magnetospirillaceae bacterium]|jgi:signal transduction histidine kinase